MPWVSDDDGFCKRRTPEGCTFSSSNLKIQQLALVSMKHTIISSQVLFCHYNRNSDSTTITVMYAESPKAYYEVREYNFQKHVGKEVYVLFRTANTHTSS